MWVGGGDFFDGVGYLYNFGSSRAAFCFEVRKIKILSLARWAASRKDWRAELAPTSEHKRPPLDKTLSSTKSAVGQRSASFDAEGDGAERAVAKLYVIERLLPGEQGDGAKRRHRHRGNAVRINFFCAGKTGAAYLSVLKFGRTRLSPTEIAYRTHRLGSLTSV